MAKPPSGYPGPEGYPCGKSWKKAIIVTGQLPRREWGKHLSHSLGPVVADLEVGPNQLGWDGPYEQNRREQMLDRLETVHAQLEAAATWLSKTEVASIEWLLDHARAELDAARDIHRQWIERKDGSFPLSFGDKLKDFPAAKHWQDCANPDDILSPPGPHYGFEVPGVGRSGDVTCPNRVEMKRRKKDRDQIGARFVDAAHHIRCAEYGLWRLQLYRKARQEWEDSPTGGGAPGGLKTPTPDPWMPGSLQPTPEPPPFGLKTPPPKPGIGGYLAPDGLPPPPEDPPDIKLPPPGPPVDPQPQPTGPDAVTGTKRPTHAKKRAKKSVAPVIAGAALGGVALWAVTR